MAAEGEGDDVVFEVLDSLLLLLLLLHIASLLASLLPCTLDTITTLRQPSLRPILPRIRKQSRVVVQGVCRHGDGDAPQDGVARDEGALGRGHAQETDAGGGEVTEGFVDAGAEVAEGVEGGGVGEDGWGGGLWL